MKGVGLKKRNNIAYEGTWLEKKTMLQLSIEAFVNKVTKDYKLRKSKQQKEVQSLLAMNSESLCWHPTFSCPYVYDGRQI